MFLIYGMDCEQDKLLRYPVKNDELAYLFIAHLVHV